MSDTNNEINLRLREAAANVRVAEEAYAAGDTKYVEHIKSAGASTYAAFTLAIKAAPEYQGRLINDAAILRIYKSTKPRRWWDAHLAKIKAAGKDPREWAKRLIQWHIDPERAQARRTKDVALRAANHLKLKEKSDAQGRRRPQVEPEATTKAPLTAEMREIHKAAQDAAHAGREMPSLDVKEPALQYTHDDCYGVIHRMKVAVGKLKQSGQLNEAFEFLNITARQIEGLS